VELERVNRPATRQQIAAIVGSLKAAFPGSTDSDKAKVMLEHYVNGLDDLPLASLQNAARASVRECRFFPTVAELRERCTSHRADANRLYRARIMIERHDRYYRAPLAEADRVKPAEIAALIRRVGHASEQRA